MSITSRFNWSGREVAGVVLGEPVVLDDGTFVWDGAGSGELDEQGRLISAGVGAIVAPSLAPEQPPVAEAEAAAGVRSLTVDDSGQVVGLDAKGKPVDVVEVWAQLDPDPVLAHDVLDMPVDPLP